MKRRIEELESELREKETVSGRALSRAAHVPWASVGDHPGTRHMAVGRVTGPGSRPDSSTETRARSYTKAERAQSKALTITLCSLLVFITYSQALRSQRSWTFSNALGNFHRWSLIRS